MKKCPTIYPEVTTEYADGRKETRTNVPCGGHLVECDVCHEETYCTREQQCIKTSEWHVKRGFFSIDDEDVFPGYTYGEHWNGFACPMFEKEDGLQIAKGINAFSPYSDGSELHFDEGTDTFIYSQPTGKPDEREVVDWFKGRDVQTPDGVKHLYDIGSHSWIWTEAENPDRKGGNL